MRQFIFCFFYPTFFLFFASLFIRGPLPFENHTVRQVAQSASVDCNLMYEMILDMDRVKQMRRGRIRSLVRLVARKWKGIWSDYPIDIQRYMFYRQQIEEILKTKDVVPPEMLQTHPEALLAYMMEINKKYHLNIEDNVKAIKDKQRKRIHKIFNQIGSEYKWTLATQRTLVGEFLQAALGPDAQIIGKEIFDDDLAERRALYRLIILRIYYYGLEESLKDTGLFVQDENFFKVFLNSSVGQVIISGAMFAPFFAHSQNFLPYLPKLSYLIIPWNDLEKAFMKGWSDEALKELDDSLIDTYQLTYFTRPANRERIRRWSGIIQKWVLPVLTVGLIAWDYYKYQEEKNVKNEEQDYLGDKLATVVSFLQSAQEIDDVGINIWKSWNMVDLNTGEQSAEKTKKQQLREVMSNHVCRDLKDCYMDIQLQLDVNELDRDNPVHAEAIGMCVEEYDGGDSRLCPSL